MGITTESGGQASAFAAVKAIVESHTGSIHVESGACGTTFEISFPEAE